MNILQFLRLLLLGSAVLLASLHSAKAAPLEPNPDPAFFKAMDKSVPTEDIEDLRLMLFNFNVSPVLTTSSLRRQIKPCFDAGIRNLDPAMVKCSWAMNTVLYELMQVSATSLRTSPDQLRPGYVIVPYVDHEGGLHLEWMETAQAERRRYDEYLRSKREKTP